MKSVPRKRASRRAVGAVAPRKTAVKKTVRRRVPRRKEMESVESRAPDVRVDSESERPVRKAPTPIAASRRSNKAKRKQLLIVGVIFIVGMGASALVGFTDAGVIDVNKEIEERNERLRSGQLGENDTQRVIVPVQNTAANQLPDGGLIGLPVSATPPPPPPEPATTTATSTDDVASSTDAVAEEGESEEVVDEGADEEEVPDALSEEVSSEDVASESITTEPAPTSSP